MEESILNYFPINIQKKIYGQVENFTNLEEIRIRTNKPIILKYTFYEKIIDCIITYKEMIEIVQRICENSIYSYQNQICQGFITVKGGHRVGITGNAVIENGNVININYISSINFRIAREITGCSNKLLRYILNTNENTVYNTLIISPPGAGKTTILRDLVRNISNGITSINFDGITVGLVDERGEIAASYKGISQNNIGIRTDVITNISKSMGINMLIRSMAPKVVVADEIGIAEDVKAINYAVCSGVKGIFTAHGGNLEEVLANPILSELIGSHIFERIVFLNSKIKKGEILKIYELNRKKKEYCSMEWFYGNG